MDTIINAAFVSCDIVGHGAASDHATQLRNVKGLNDCIRAVCKDYFDSTIIWASGGDGGHVAFLDDGLRETAVALIQALFQWAQDARRQDRDAGAPETSLRITAHYGPVSITEGADQRKQLVGDGINFCGSLLGFGTPGAVVVSSAFRDFVLRGQGAAGSLVAQTRFHHERNLYLKHFVAQRVYFMSITGVFDSLWGFPEKSDRTKLKEAQAKKRRWRVIYHAKRLLQVDSSDQDANRALELLNPKQLLVARNSVDDLEVNPLLGQMRKEALIRLIHAAHLIEREDGEVICANNDSGDTMFIVLMGQIGIVIERDPAAPGAAGAPLDIRLGEGECLGELALALQRRRTATLQAVGPTALLAIDYATLTSLLNSVPENDPLRASFNEFLMSRSLEHLCRKTPYLACCGQGPLADTERPWDWLVHGSKQIVLSWDRTISAAQDECKEPGLYVLASGRLTETSRSPHAGADVNFLKNLDGHDFPILYVDLPGFLVNIHHTYQFDPNHDSKTISIVRIHAEDLKKLGAKVYAKAIDAMKRQLCKQALVDVFISYNHHDEHVARTWYRALSEAGLAVYMSQPEAMKRFKNEIDFALADALVMIPIVSKQAIRPDGEESWVQREIRYRKTLFDENHCNILPIEISPGIAGEMADGFSALAVTGSGETSIKEAIDAVRAVREGRKPPPFSLRRLTGKPL